jgi:hypoxanthine-DNA glycosylase
LFGGDYSAEYEIKTSELLWKGVALWDVLQSCERIGSSDKNIRHAQPNDLCSFLENHPRIVQVFFNGICPRELIRKLLPDLLHNEKSGFLVLPSSSSNNSHMHFDEKVRHWSVLKKK